jgi:protein SCO1/2
VRDEVKFYSKTVAALVMATTMAAPAAAQRFPEPGQPSSAKPGILGKIGIDQRLNEQVPLDLPFVDENGRDVRLGDYFGKRPVVLALVYYECPMLCTQVLNGVVSSLGVVKFNAGTEFDVIAVSINPKEGPGLAAQKKQAYVDRYKRPGTEHGFHFLTGKQESIDKLAQAVGFRYEYDAETGQYAHGAGVEILTPKGVISRYFYGIDFSPRDMQFGLMDAAEQRIGSRIDSALLLCYHYDPSTGKYGVIAIDAIRIGGVATVLAFLTFLFVSLRRERAAAKQAH